ncbi:MAG: aminotransferase class III-fold pyridoxal phosphate-dependent enzyme [Gammaproteobacteria bacterium]|nr:aminotransferase class III-fold pyridoxal phosphate-dependent enzyme [Gammaproteobacteria bacterium]
MSATCQLPQFSAERVSQLLRELFNIDAELRPLAGERDLNFLLITDSAKYVFKIANQNEDPGILDCQQQVFQRLAANNIFTEQFRAIESRHGNAIETIYDASGIPHLCRLLNYAEGRLLAAVKPHLTELLIDLGESLGKLDKALFDFEHEALHRPLLWKMHGALTVLAEFKPLLASSRQQLLIEYFESHFRDTVLPLDKSLRRSAIHNDANDNNVLIRGDDPWIQAVGCIIDFGDMVHSWTVAEPAIAAAYAMLDKDHPLATAASIVRGYHQQLSLQEAEVQVIFDLICMRLCMSVCICAYQKSLEPDNEYLSISEQPAWRLLEKLQRIPAAFAQAVFRHACNMEPATQHASITQWLRAQQKSFQCVIDIDLKNAPLLWLDLGVASPYFMHPGDPAKMTLSLHRALEDMACLAGVGGYGEYRLLYNDDAFVDADGHQRNMHLGIDIFMPAGSAIYAPMSATVFAVANHARDYDYGGCVILRHRIPQSDLEFYTLYGHLAPGSLAPLKAGDTINAGQQIAVLGDVNENGGWPPHLHFQIMLDLLGETDTFVGAGSPVYRDVWLSLCPDPNLMLGIAPTLLDHREPDKRAITASRKQTMNPSLGLSYRDPIYVLRGSMQYLYDAEGRRYLDAVNNVSHVGHCHPRVVEAGNSQARLLCTNTRYLYSSITEYCERLVQKFPDPLTVCYLVNSGSEANDLALRLARNFTQREDIVVLDHAYHGNLGALIDISPYKHDSKGGRGRPAHVHKAVIPDTYRNPASSQQYAQSIKQKMQQAEVAAFICETVLGCGGQVVLPEGYLKAAYACARESGALCIADEVQVGFGRVGTHFWGFETQQVVPDIVTLGKPIGNGHPLAAVITRRDIADSFDNGMEYFNTFGGNPVSCAIGLAVLDVIEDEQLQDNALVVGEFLLGELRKLQQHYALIGEVRGLGLFIGIELVTDRQTKEPAAMQASYIAERMQQGGILISTDGPFHNVLKIKPPMCFSHDNALQLVTLLDNVLQEDFAGAIPL